MTKIKKIAETLYVRVPLEEKQRGFFGHTRRGMASAGVPSALISSMFAGKGRRLQAAASAAAIMTPIGALLSKVTQGAHNKRVKNLKALHSAHLEKNGQYTNRHAPSPVLPELHTINQKNHEEVARIADAKERFMDRMFRKNRTKHYNWDYEVTVGKQLGYSQKQLDGMKLKADQDRSAYHEYKYKTKGPKVI